MTNDCLRESLSLESRYTVATFSSSSFIDRRLETQWWAQRSIRTRNCSPIKVFSFRTLLFSSLLLLLLTPIFSNPFTVFPCVFFSSPAPPPSLSLCLSIARYVPSPACFSQYRIYLARSTIVKLASAGPRKVSRYGDVSHSLVLTIKLIPDDASTTMRKTTRER